jgi:hypothetical protein
VKFCVEIDQHLTYKFCINFFCLIMYRRGNGSKSFQLTKFLLLLRRVWNFSSLMDFSQSVLFLTFLSVFNFALYVHSSTICFLVAVLVDSGALNIYEIRS